MAGWAQRVRASLQCIGFTFSHSNSPTDRSALIRRARQFVAALMIVPALVFGQAQMATPGSFSVAPSGSASYAILTQVPPGTAGMQPSLSLAYNSQSGNGLAGVGWSVSGLSTIHRCAATYVQDGVSGEVNYDANDKFCLDGERLIAINAGAYIANGQEYRTEHESFTRIIAYGVTGFGPQYFKAWIKSGQILQYGLTTNVYANYNNYPSVAIWPITSIQDRANNIMTFDYFNGGSEFYPTRIMYIGRSNNSQDKSVWFNYEARGDVEVSWNAGSVLTSTQRLTHIKTCLGQLECSVGNNMVKDYRLTYGTSPANSRSRLSSVMECDGGGTCLPGTTFGWQDQIDGWTTSTWSGGSVPGNPFGSTCLSGDINGDGKTDMWCYTGVGSSWVVNISTGSGWSTAGWTGPTPPSGSASQCVTGDFNGDGKTDMTCYTTAGVWDMRLSTGSNWIAVNWPSGLLPSNPFSSSCQSGDINGDGKTDLWCYSGVGGNWLVNISTGSGWTNVWWSGPAPGSLNQCITGDFNGDGKTDMTCYTGANGAWDMRLSTGSSWRASTWAGGSVPGNPFSSSCMTGDINGDGKTDMWCYSGGGGNWLVNISTGSGWSSVWWSGAAPGNNIGNQCRSGDINGDSKTDMWCYTGAGGTWDVRKSTGSAWTVSGWSGVAPANLSQCITGDFNGDAKTDMTCHTSGGTWDVRTVQGNFPDLLTSVATGLGAQTIITHKPLTDPSVYSKSSGSIWPILDVQTAMYVVSNVQTSNGIGGMRSSTYSYQALRAHALGRGLLGFNNMSVVDDQLGTGGITYFTQAGACAVTSPSGYTDYACVGMPYYTSHYAPNVALGNNSILPTVVSTYPGVYFAYSYSSTENFYITK